MVVDLISLAFDSLRIKLPPACSKCRCELITTSILAESRPMARSRALTSSPGRNLSDLKTRATAPSFASGSVCRAGCMPVSKSTLPLGCSIKYEGTGSSTLPCSPSIKSFSRPPRWPQSRGVDFHPVRSGSCSFARCPLGVAHAAPRRGWSHLIRLPDGIQRAGEAPRRIASGRDARPEGSPREPRTGASSECRSDPSCAAPACTPGN